MIVKLKPQMPMGKVIPSACITANRTLITDVRAKVHLVILRQTPKNIKPNHHIFINISIRANLSRW